MKRPWPRRSVDAQPIPATLSSVRRALIVTDRSIHAAALQSILDGETDFSVVGLAATYAVAVHKARDLQPDLLLVDLAMHALNERLLMHALHTASPDSTIVVLNGTGSPEDEANAIDEGADVYLDGYIGTAQMVAALRTARRWGTPS
jgi:DNA-binding NarL/FixJ family response regulator